jgi:hypothetical protein
MEGDAAKQKFARGTSTNPIVSRMEEYFPFIKLRQELANFRGRKRYHFR